MDCKVYIAGIVESTTANSTLEAAHKVLSSHGLVSARSVAVCTYHQTIEYRDCMIIDDTLEYLGSSVIDTLEIDWIGLTVREEQPTMAETFDQARRYAKLMGIMYGVITACELTGTPVVYQAVKDAMKQHCTENELKQVCKELERYAHVVQTMTQQKGE